MFFCVKFHAESISDTETKQFHHFLKISIFDTLKKGFFLLFLPIL